jgi:type IV secretory pathway TraG/TraD family ATPase VirD4
VLGAPGAAFATSNKPDLFAACAGPRANRGRVWNFDPQQICRDVDPDWWWNPLSYVINDRRASELTTAFVDAYRPADARTDAYFDKAGQSLIAGLLQAAALDGRPITDVYVWSTREDDDEPAVILEEHGLALAAAGVRSIIDAPHEQRGGVYGTAQELLGFLRDPEISRWVTDADHRRPELDLTAFVQSADTLFLHSKEGPGSSAGLVTALTMALCDAAEQVASRSPRGRLAVPLVGVLDEAANICRWRQLPDLYSHYGSRGIVLLTILQSWSQGGQVWGEAGMKKLWGASNIRCYGGGAAEREFLSDLEAQIGDYNRRVRSPSSSSGHGGSSRSISEQLTPTPILTVAELASLPRDRVVVIPSGAPPILARPVPWWQTPDAAAIEASIAAHDPAAAPPANPYLAL